MQQKIKNRFSDFARGISMVAVGTFIGLSIHWVAAWTEPSVTPPDSIVGAPLNTSNTPQTKSGGLGVSALNATALSAGSIASGPLSAASANISGGLGLGGQAAPVSGIKFSDGSVQTTAPAAVAGDNLGNHTATQDLNMGGRAIVNLDFVNVTDGIYFDDGSSLTTAKHPAAAPVVAGCNDGGAGFDSNCPAGYVMTGIRVASNLITLRCSRL